MLIVYLDGIFDLFHRGHIESIKQAKFLEKDVYLIIGLISDEDARKYKRSPIISFDDRLEIIKSIKYVDKVIEKAPLFINKKFLVDNNIDIVVHGFYDEKDKNKQIKFFDDLIIEGKFKEIKYYDKISTTEIINRINKINFF